MQTGCPNYSSPGLTIIKTLVLGTPKKNLLSSYVLDLHRTYREGSQKDRLRSNWGIRYNTTDVMKTLYS